jgi:hypothetical protein
LPDQVKVECPGVAHQVRRQRKGTVGTALPRGSVKVNNRLSGGGREEGVDGLFCVPAAAFTLDKPDRCRTRFTSGQRRNPLRVAVAKSRYPDPPRSGEVHFMPPRRSVLRSRASLAPECAREAQSHAA